MRAPHGAAGRRAGALAAAVEDAEGIRVHRMPLSPDDLHRLRLRPEAAGQTAAHCRSGDCSGDAEASGALPPSERGR
ncbi:hypothetical protein Acsp04_08020 [Actinomadura sp. NBRC 104425]|nr:hypothetical protein Acsp04_08020 [Actinomadura sp. NBRC 104425]